MIIARSCGWIGLMAMPAGAATRVSRYGRHTPSREGVDVAEAERQVDRPAELGGVEAHGPAGGLDDIDAAPQEPQAMPFAALRRGDQHHADPRHLGAERQGQRGGDPPARRVLDAERGARGDHQAPVGGDLVPAGLDGQRPHGLGIVRLEAQDRQPGRVRSGHRAPRSASACHGSRRRASANRQSSRSCAAGRREGCRTRPPCVPRC